MYVKGIRVAKDVLTTFFECDYDVCKGYCCHPEDGLGCIISKEEGEAILRDKDIIAERIPVKDKKKVAVNLVKDNVEGAELGVADDGRCILECEGCILTKLKEEGVTSYGIPISCGLYPLYYDEEKNFLFIADFYDNDVCDCGYRKGASNRTHIVEFCKDALIRKFGEEFYDALSRLIVK